MATVSVFLWLQEKAKDHLGAVLVTVLNNGPCEFYNRRLRTSRVLWGLQRQTEDHLSGVIA